VTEGRAGATLRLASTPEQLACLAAEEIRVVLGTAVAWRGAAHLCLAGGSTPRLLHAELARQPFDGWPRVHIWFGDERCVPHDHPDSNARMAEETLLRHVPVAPHHVHRLAGALDPHEAARQYHTALQDLAEREARDVPCFDALVLGLGDDGHTASVFPGSALLGEDAAPEAWCVAEHVPHLDAWRLTVTPPVLRGASTTVVLVTGTSKHEALQRVLTGAAPLQQLPARLLEAARGDVAWFVDADAMFGS
jgi:6-phosphogluconolactonase